MSEVIGGVYNRFNKRQENVYGWGAEVTNETSVVQSGPCKTQKETSTLGLAKLELNKIWNPDHILFYRLSVQIDILRFDLYIVSGWGINLTASL